jgi:hypothetical protein
VLIFSVSYGLPYFSRLPQALVAKHMPAGNGHGGSGGGRDGHGGSGGGHGGSGGGHGGR